MTNSAKNLLLLVLLSSGLCLGLAKNGYAYIIARLSLHRSMAEDRICMFRRQRQR